MYRTISQVAADRAPTIRVLILSCNVVSLAIFLTSGYFLCIDNAVIGYALFESVIIGVALIISGLFSYYGIKITRQLYYDRKEQIGADSITVSEDFYQVTLNTTILSVTFLTGICIAAIFGSLSAKDPDAVWADVSVACSFPYQVILVVEILSFTQLRRSVRRTQSSFYI